jgi:hypothetical protein
VFFPSFASHPVVHVSLADETHEPSRLWVPGDAPSLPAFDFLLHFAPFHHYRPLPLPRMCTSPFQSLLQLRSNSLSVPSHHFETAGGAPVSLTSIFSHCFRNCPFICTPFRTYSSFFADSMTLQLHIRHIRPLVLYKLISRLRHLQD